MGNVLHPVLVIFAAKKSVTKNQYTIVVMEDAFFFKLLLGSAVVLYLGSMLMDQTSLSIFVAIIHNLQVYLVGILRYLGTQC